MGGDWYERWFNKDYLSVYAHRDTEEAALQINLILNECDCPQGKSYLDLACGTGRYTAQLQKKGLEVTGMDLSKALLDHARELYPALRFEQGDMRKLKGKYFGVFSFFTSFAYFDHKENLETLRSIYNATEKGGFLWLDFFNRNREEINLPSESFKKTPKLRIHEKKYIKDGRVNKRIEIKTSTGEIRKYKESVYFYHPYELQEMLEACGYAIEKTFGSYKGDSLVAKSPRCIMLCRKN